MFYDELSSPTSVYGNSDFPAMSSKVPSLQVPQVDFSVNSGMAKAGEHLAGWVIGLIVAGCVLLAAAVATVIFLILRSKKNQNPNYNSDELSPIDKSFGVSQNIPITENESLRPLPLWARLRINNADETEGMTQSEVDRVGDIGLLVENATFGYHPSGRYKGVHIKLGDADGILVVKKDDLRILENDFSVSGNENDIATAFKATEELVKDVRSSENESDLGKAALSFRTKVGLTNLDDIQSVFEDMDSNAKIVKEQTKDL